MRIKHQGASYLSSGSRLTKKARRRTLGTFLVASALTLVTLGTLTLSAFSAAPAQVLAAEEENQKLQEAFNSFGLSSDAEGFAQGLDRAATENAPTSFGYALQRLFSINYINDIDNAVVAGDLNQSLAGRTPNLSNPGATRWACAPNATGAGTVVYHNCDVPNILTEFVQDAASIIDQSGVQGAEVQGANTAFGFGLPKNLPGNGAVPVDENARNAKYTGLELFGYTLRYSTYGGEWDHIKTMSNARTLANFGFFDSIKLSSHSVVNGITSGLDTAVNNLSGRLSSGDIFGAIGSAYTGFISGAAGGTLDTIFDTSDLNVIGTNAWYRVGFGGTTYGARELTDAELAAQARVAFISMVTDTSPDDATVDAALMNIQGGPPDPKEAISKCEVISADGNRVEWGNTSTDPGPSEAQCQAQADANFQVRKDAYDEGVKLRNEENAKYNESRRERNEYLEQNPGDFAGAPALYQRKEVTVPFEDSQSAQIWWSKDGTQKLETIEEWTQNHAAIFSTARDYGMQCSVNTNESQRKNTIAQVRSCWSSEWPKARDQNLIDNQSGINIDWLDGVIDPANVASWAASSPEHNFNAPWNRFVCTDEEGNDILNANGQNIRVYNSDGSVNPACGQGVRSPIQGGLFGDGYTAQQTAGLSPDTRHIDNFGGVSENIFFPAKAWGTNAANFFLIVAQFLTMISNEVISWTFSPLLQALNLDTIVVDLISGFRDSIFMPLSVMVIAAAGIYILWQAGTKKNYREQFTSLLMIALVFISGVVLLARPAETVRLVDEVPSYVERAVIGAIYNVGANPNDQLCTASGAASQNSNGLFGTLSGFTPDAAARTLMCENWRAFVFSPWVYGQWGTSLDNLYSSGTNDPNRWGNTNEALVGTAGVRMGGGVTMNNWGVYQLDVMSSGTATTADPSARAGVVSQDFYRIVDAQAGPNGGAGREDAYLDAWSGASPVDRALTGFFSAVAATFGMVTVIAFSFTKILITFVSVLMMLFLPFVFLIGLFPAKRSEVGKYVLSVLGLMVQRILLVVMLAVFFKLLLGFANMATGGYVLVALMSLVTCVLFLMFRKQIMTFAFGALGGRGYGGNWVTAPGQYLMDHTPRGIKQFGSLAQVSAVSVAGGALAGLATGQGAGRGAREAWDVSKQRFDAGLRRQGYGLLYGAKKNALDTNRKVKDRLRSDKNVAYTYEGIAAQTQERQEFKLAEEAYLKLKSDPNGRFMEKEEPRLADDGSQLRDANGRQLTQKFLVDLDNQSKRVMDKPVMPFMKSDNRSITTRELSASTQLRQKVAELRVKRDELQEKRTRPYSERAALLKESGAYATFSDDERAALDDLMQRHVQADFGDSHEANFSLLDDKYDKELASIERKIERLEDQAARVESSIARREDNDYTRGEKARGNARAVEAVRHYMDELDEDWGRKVDQQNFNKNRKYNSQ